jgi:hypothetical protein
VTRRSAVVDRVDDLSRVDPVQVNRRNPEMRVLPLNDRQRDPFVRHLDRARVSELMPRKPPAHSGLGRESTQLTAGGGRRPAATARRACEDAEQRTDGQLDLVFDPATELLPAQSSVPTILRLPPLPARTQDRPSPRVKIGLAEPMSTRPDERNPSTPQAATAAPRLLSREFDRYRPKMRAA